MQGELEQALAASDEARAWSLVRAKDALITAWKLELAETAEQEAHSE